MWEREFFIIKMKIFSFCKYLNLTSHIRILRGKEEHVVQKNIFNDCYDDSVIH